MAKTINVFVLSLFKNLEHIAVINERLHEIPRFFFVSPPHRLFGEAVQRGLLLWHSVMNPCSSLVELGSERW